MTDHPLPPGVIARRLRVHGRVQGVFYRGWTVESARALGLNGWVRNRQDGTVEILAVGPVEAVETLTAHCHRGPPAAQVTQVEVEPALGITPEGFIQKPTV